MINLEWLRTFRAVYKTKSLSRAAEILAISQPTVSQHLSSLESRLEQKLFTRKSKGVVETDPGRMLNTMVSGTIENLEEVELLITQKHSKLKNIINIGISEHLYKTILCPKVTELGDHVHIKFGNKNQLIKEVEEGKLMFAVIPDQINTFDTICHKIRAQSVLLIGTPDIDFSEYRKLFKKDLSLAEQWLGKHVWYAHDNNSNFIKIYWLTVYNKKRPSIIPNYIVPNEYEVLFQQSNGSGLSVAFDTTAAPFLKTKQLHSCEVKQVVYRDLSLLSNKKKADPLMTRKIVKLLSVKYT